MSPAPERSAAQLLSTFGPPPPRRPVELATSTRGGRVNQPRAPRRGTCRPGAGWAPVEAPLAIYQASTHEIGGLFPLLAANGIPAVGARIGYDTLSGGAFYCHSIEWVLRGLATNPNMVIFGEPGRARAAPSSPSCYG